MISAPTFQTSPARSWSRAGDSRKAAEDELSVQAQREARPQHHGMRIVVSGAQAHEHIAAELPPQTDRPRYLPAGDFRGRAVFWPASRDGVAQDLRKELAALPDWDDPAHCEVDQVVHRNAVGLAEERVSEVGVEVERAEPAAHDQITRIIGLVCPDEPAFGGGELHFSGKGHGGASGWLGQDSVD